MISYQLERPVHRFGLELQSGMVGATGLPQGVKEGDMLVELDGRPMVPKVGTEGLRSIVFSRPAAHLVLERRESVFTDQLVAPIEARPTGALVGFGLALLMGLALRWLRHETISRWTTIATAFETLAFAWCAMIFVQYQWVMADYALAYATVAALIVARPLGIFARTASAEDGGQKRWGGLIAGGVGASFAIIALSTGGIESAERALQFAAVCAGLFVVFEVVLTGMSEGSGVLLGERSVYLAGLIVLVLLSAVIAYTIDPVTFVEERWRWFAAIVLSLVWFGDVLLCVRGVPATQFSDIADGPARSQSVGELLDQFVQVYPQVASSLIVAHERQGALLFSRAPQREGVAPQVVIERAPQAARDAVEIMFHEQARVPGGHPASDDPIAGIAHSMGWGLALELFVPPRSIEIEGVRVALVGTQIEGVAPIPLEDLDLAQQRLGAASWSALVVEALERWCDGATIAQAPAPVEVAREPIAPAPDAAHNEALERAHQERAQAERALVLTRDGFARRRLCPPTSTNCWRGRCSRPSSMCVSSRGRWRSWVPRAWARRS